MRSSPLLPLASALLAIAVGVAHADTRIFSVETDRPGVTVTSVERNGTALPVDGTGGTKTFFRIDAGSETVPCNNRLAFHASNGQRLEYMVDLCAHNWQVKLPLGTAEAPATPAAPSAAPPSGGYASLSVSTDNPDVTIEEVVLDGQALDIGEREKNGVRVALPAGKGATCEHDLGLALSDGRRIARSVNICTYDGAVVVALNSDTAAPPPGTLAASPPPPPPPAAESSPPPEPPLASGEPEIVDGLVWQSGHENGRATLVYGEPNSDNAAFYASCTEGTPEIDVSLDRSAPDLREGGSVTVAFTAGTVARSFTATGSEPNAIDGLSRPELTVPASDPLWPALIRGDYLTIRIGSAQPYALSLKGSSAAARPFLGSCSGSVASATPQPAPPPARSGGYGCSEEGRAFSQRSNIPARMIFHNESSREIELFWLDYDGRRRPYMSLAPGETGVQPSFFSHPWLVADRGGRCLGIYYARRGDAEFVIGR